MVNDQLIKIGGIFHLICALSHILFPKVFKWEENLQELPPIKKITIRKTMHLMNTCILIFWLILAYIPFFYSNEILATKLGKVVLTSIIFFWIIRIFVLQPILIGLKTKESWLRTAFFIFGLMLFFIPWLSFFGDK